METRDVIKLLCKERGISVSALEEALGFGNGSLMKGKSIYSDRLFKLSQFFSVPMEFLVTGDKSYLSRNSALWSKYEGSKEFMTYIETLWNLPDDNKKHIYRQIRFEESELEKGKKESSNSVQEYKTA